MVTTAPSGSTISVSLTTGPPSLGRVASVAGARAPSQYRDGEAVAMGGERLVEALRSDRAVAVVGAGTMGAGIAQVAAAAGHPVLLHDVREGAAERAIRGVAAALERRVAQGKLAAEASAAIVGRITPRADLPELAPAGLVVEAIVEELEAKRGLFRALEAVVGADAILATNTSSISVTAIGAALGAARAAGRDALLQPGAGDGAGRGRERAGDGAGRGRGRLRDRGRLGQEPGARPVDARLHRQPCRPAVLRRGVARAGRGRRGRGDA